MSKSNQQKYFEGITNWQQSGLSQKAWCEQNNVSYGVFHYWYKRFRNEQTGNNQSNTSDGFVQLLVQDRPSGIPWCELMLGKGHKLFFHQPVPAEFIRSLLA
jgi:hypothetical protein